MKYNIKILNPFWNRTALGRGYPTEESLGVPTTYSGAYASCIIAYIKQALKARLKLKYNIKILNPFWNRTALGRGYPTEESLGVPTTYSGAYASCIIAYIKQALKACYKFT